MGACPPSAPPPHPDLPPTSKVVLSVNEKNTRNNSVIHALTRSCPRVVLHLKMLHSIFVGVMENPMVTKFIIIEDFHAVGMRHWCERSLHRGEVLSLVREPENPFDENAVALYNQNGSEKMAYIGRFEAKGMKILMEHPHILNRCSLIAIVTGNWEIDPVYLDQGPRQTCNVALQVFEHHYQEIVNCIKEIGFAHADVV